MAKVIFLHLIVILFTGGGGSASVHAGIPLPGSRHPPGADPPGEQTPRDGLRAAGTHPTGMHSCRVYESAFISPLSLITARKRSLFSLP